MVSGFLLLPLLPCSAPADPSSGLATPAGPADTEPQAGGPRGRGQDCGAAASLGFLGDRAQKDRASVLVSAIVCQSEGVCLMSGEGPRRTAFIHQALRPAPSPGAMGAGGKGRGATREACPGAFSPQRCSPRLPSPTSQRAGEALFKARPLPSLAGSSKLPGSPCARGTPQKAFFVPASQWGHPQGALERPVRARGHLRQGHVGGRQEGAGQAAGSRTWGGTGEGRRLENTEPLMGIRLRD